MCIVLVGKALADAGLHYSDVEQACVGYAFGKHIEEMSCLNVMFYLKECYHRNIILGNI